MFLTTSWTTTILDNYLSILDNYLFTNILYLYLQRKRKLCLAETMKTGRRQAVLGIRISEFRVLNGTAIDHIQKVG